MPRELTLLSIVLVIHQLHIECCYPEESRSVFPLKMMIITPLLKYKLQNPCKELGFLWDSINNNHF